MRFKLTPFRRSQTPRPPWLAAVFILAYALSALVSYKWTLVTGGLAVFWLNNGLVAAALLLLSPRPGLAVALAGLAVDVAGARFIGGSAWGQAIMIGGCDFGEAWLAAVLIRNAGGAGLDLTQVRRFLGVIARGVLPATLLAGTCGSVLFHLLYSGDLPAMWANWALGDFLGMSIATPTVLIVVRFRRFDQPRQLSPWASSALLLALSAMAVTPFYVSGPPLAFLVFPLFLVAAFRLTPPYAAAALAIVAVCGAGLTITGRGPFAAPGLVSGAGILRLQVFLACAAFTIFLAQGSLADRSRSQVRLRRALVRVRRARGRAEAASVAKSEFLANMSHEIRTPLNGVIAMAELLARSDLSAHDRKLVEIVRASGESLNRLLSDILDLARIEAGCIELEQAPLHLGDTVRSAAALCGLRAQEKGLPITVEVAAEVDRCFEGDEVRIRQIVTNLVSNAVKFTARGEVRVRVCEAPAGGVRIEVSDTGVGFDPELRERLFDRFQQADGSITRRFGGTGLGLPISRQLAQAMGGSLQCDSTPGQGSRFWFDAPLTPTEPVPAAAAKEDPRQALRGRVLVVDDHPTNRTVAELILGDFGFEVEVAEDGAEALATLAAQAFDLVLMDMQMPVMDGLTAVRRLREREAALGLARTPVLMLTANALPEHAAQSAAAGADGHVAKPITAAALMAAIVALAEPQADTDPARRAAAGA